VYNESLLTHFWKLKKDDLAASTLARYIVNEMPMASQRGDYQVRVHPRRQAAWLKAASSPVGKER
jgi:hypothetical protein